MTDPSVKKECVECGDECEWMSFVEGIGWICSSCSEDLS